MKKARKKPPAEGGDKKQAFDRPNYLPIYLVGLTNGLTRGASRIYLRLYGVGIIEWRILSILSIGEGFSANDICLRIDLDKAAASRSIRLLEKRGLVTTQKDPDDSRRRTLVMTQAGTALHQKLQRIALKRQELMLTGFTRAEHMQLVSLLRRMQNNMRDVDDFDYSSLA